MSQIDDPDCEKCGRPKSAHAQDPMTGEPTKCPVVREESHTPPQEHRRSPAADY